MNAERYQSGWGDWREALREVEPQFKYCEECKRETPHVDGCCVYVNIGQKEERVRA